MTMSTEIRGFLAAGILLAAGAHAHDPSLHKANAESPKCEKLKNMHDGDMKVDDPIMQALMKQCMQESHDNSDGKSAEAASDASTGGGHDH